MHHAVQSCDVARIRSETVAIVRSQDVAIMVEGLGVLGTSDVGIMRCNAVQWVWGFSNAVQCV